MPLNINSMFAYLILPDGGKVEFKAQRYTNGTYFWYRYHVTAIYDPYGLKTTINSAVTPNGVRRRITQVMEPAGRYLQFSYVTTNGPRISQVTSSDGRAVNYSYQYCNGCRLYQVVYYNNATNWTARYQYTTSNIGGELPPLLWTCDDPMYAGPMKRIAYEYKPLTPNNPDGTTPVYGQILRERYCDGTNVGVAVSTLTVGEAPNVTWKRQETRGDGATRNFVYSGAGQVVWASDFMGHQSTVGYDDKKYLNSFIDFNRNETNYANDPITGNVTQINYPLTPGDTPGQGNSRPTVNYTYTNNYYLHTIQGENGFTTTITRDGNNRVTRIDYPDVGYETFAYDPSHFYQLSSHRMTTGGVETFTHNGRAGLKDTYRNPDTASGNPSAHYYYDTLDRVSDITDVLGTSDRDPAHTISFTYNDRGQITVTTLAKDPANNNTRHSINNYYNSDGTLFARTNEIYQTTSYAYDDYRRLKSVTTPVRGYGDNNTHTSEFSYYVNGIWDDYSHTDSKVCWVHLPSGKWINTVYDDNLRKTSVTVAPGTADEATTLYRYDSMGSPTSVINPLNHNNVTTVYDERNRPSSTSVGGHTTTFTYDTAGRQKTITRPNNQVITNASFDSMNRVLLQTASNVSTGNNYNMVTQYQVLCAW